MKRKRGTSYKGKSKKNKAERKRAKKKGRESDRNSAVGIELPPPPPDIDEDDDNWTVGDGTYDDIPESDFGVWRFRVDVGEEGVQIIFLDGDGLFTEGRQYFPYVEHNVKVDGWWVCDG